MKPLWIGRGKLVLPRGIVCGGSVLIENGQITQINTKPPCGAEILSAEGEYILPGFIDTHLHGGGGADFMDADVDAFLTVAKTHLRHGTTAISPTTMTCSDDLLFDVIACYLKAKKAAQNLPEFLGLHLEGPFFAPSSKGAQQISGLRLPDERMIERTLRLAQGEIIRWDEAPELDGTDVFARLARTHGLLASVAHTQADATECMAAFDAGFSHVTHLYSATTSFHKKNGIVHAGVVEAAYLRDDVTVELIMDGRHIPKETLLLAHKIKGSDKICFVTDAMRAAGTDETSSILGPRDGGVPVIIKDDVAQLPDFSSYAGSVGLMDNALRTAHLRYGLPLQEVSKMLSLTPARLAKVEKRKGSIECGKDADIVILSPDFYVKNVILRGQIVSESGN